MHRKTQELTAPLADTLDRASSARATRGRARRRRDDDDLRVWPSDDPEADIRKFQVGMDPARADVLAAVAAQGVAITGPLFSYHFRMTPETFDFVVGVPVAAPVAAVGRVTPGELPAARAARTVYHGPYEGLGAAWGAFETWIAAEGHARRPDLWERYLVGPEDGAEPPAWQTELSHPLGAESRGRPGRLVRGLHGGGHLGRDGVHDDAERLAADRLDADPPAPVRPTRGRVRPGDGHDAGRSYAGHYRVARVPRVGPVDRRDTRPRRVADEEPSCGRSWWIHVRRCARSARRRPASRRPSRASRPGRRSWGPGGGWCRARGRGRR